MLNIKAAIPVLIDSIGLYMEKIREQYVHFYENRFPIQKKKPDFSGCKGRFSTFEGSYITLKGLKQLGIQKVKLPAQLQFLFTVTFDSNGCSEHSSFSIVRKPEPLGIDHNK